jgi:hypothetical protein
MAHPYIFRSKGFTLLSGLAHPLISGPVVGGYSSSHLIFVPELQFRTGVSLRSRFSIPIHSGCVVFLGIRQTTPLALCLWVTRLSRAF